jgi:hypothetical protein
MPKRPPDPLRASEVAGGRRASLALAVVLAVVAALVILIVVLAVR